MIGSKQAWVFVVVPAALCGVAAFAGCSSSSSSNDAGTGADGSGQDGTTATGEAGSGVDTGTTTSDTGASDSPTDATEGGPSDGGAGDAGEAAVDPFKAGSVQCGTTTCDSTGNTLDAGGCCFVDPTDASPSACITGFSGSSCAAKSLGGGQYSTAIQIGCDSLSDCSSGVCCFQNTYLSNTVSCVAESSCVHVSGSPYSTYSFRACDPSASPSECTAGTTCTPMSNLAGYQTDLYLCLQACSPDAGTAACTAPQTCGKNTAGTEAYCQ